MSNMSNSTTFLPANDFPAHLNIILVGSVIMAVLSPVAVMGNTLVLAAIWKKTFQRTLFHVLLSGLAVSDLCTGLIAQPLAAAAFSLMFKYAKFTLNPPHFSTITDITAEGIASYFIFLMLLIMTLMSVERWMHMSRHNLVTLKGRYVTTIVLLLLPTPLAVCSPLVRTFGRGFYIPPAIVMLLCILTTSFAYFNVIRIIRAHQQQVRAHAPPEKFGRQAINLEKYKKSVYTILYIMALFYFCFLPFVISLWMYIHHNSETFLRCLNLSYSLSFLSSSLNPCLYLWRMNDVRNGVKQLFCLSN